MDTLLLLAVLVCPVVMGGAMVWMTLQMRRQGRRDREDEER